MENHVIQVDYIMKFVIDQENHSHIILTCSRLATNWYLTIAIADRHNAGNELSRRDRP